MVEVDVHNVQCVVVLDLRVDPVCDSETNSSSNLPFPLGHFINFQSQTANLPCKWIVAERRTGLQKSQRYPNTEFAEL